jgi:hypothetical protein
MRNKLLLPFAACLAVLALPASASALAPSVHTTATDLGDGRFAWTCTARSLPPITGFWVRCNGVDAVGLGPARTAAGVSTGPIQVCWDGSFQYGKDFPPRWASFSGCRYGEHTL